jgi:DNA-directed RNA polymerase beta' subunit
MSQSNISGIHSKIRPSKIIGIQFSILSPDEIRKSSVAHITSRDTYINNKPVINGLFDPRMGVLEPGLVCPTDGLNYMETPGYFGHIELARPVFYIQYLTHAMKIMRCVCFKCSKLLIDKNKHKHTLSMSSKERWDYVFSQASIITRCGEENEDGCGCIQPDTVRKEGLASIYAEWKKLSSGDDDGDDATSAVIRITPEIMLKVFRRISDDDISFMGFSPIFSRPDWMICQVLAVPPPAVRPSVKHDAQQRSEDDISHIIVNIIKANKTLQEKIAQNAKESVIEDWTTVLQYYIAAMVNNDIPGVASVAQRSGRPLKSISERLNGKGGRVRGNLMGKRVDFSSRSVITGDPNLSIRQLGVPKKIAMNITYPVYVNQRNKNYLLQLVRNGPDKYPGAKILERSTGESISLKYVDRESLVLNIGDIVHRHMVDGDAVLFNRQPTLHRMSMMCHIAKIMEEGNTFRMNVADTKPYNADYDGDEMNMHMPQDDESSAELRYLAAVPRQIISPANNASIIGIFQDSLLGSFRFTRPNIEFTPRTAMNLLMAYPKVNKALFGNPSAPISNFEILSQILPPLTSTFKNSSYEDGENKKTSNNIIEIINGAMKRGQLDKNVKKLLHSIFNDYGFNASADFIDDLQAIITEYMKLSAFSVGISDLIADQETNRNIASAITKKKQEVKDLIDQVKLGVFENNTGKSNREEFETCVNSILNKAQEEAGKIGRKNLSSDNRFKIMVQAGSKGSNLNIAQMISCLGQQNVDGKRIPYGFEDRTLPHFTKYDDTPEARGFVESSFVQGLTPQELFFHAMGGRVGLIDTAVKTSKTGYIQRRLIKGMEDLKVEYDMTVRNNKSKIIQFEYGDDSIDTTKVEGQNMPFVSMTNEEIFAHYQMPKDTMTDDIYTTNYTKAALGRMKKQQAELDQKTMEYIDRALEIRKELVKYVFEYKNNKNVNVPVHFSRIIGNIKNQLNIQANSLVDITPLECMEIAEQCKKQLHMIQYAKPTRLFDVLFDYYMSPKELLLIHHFNKKGLTVLMNAIITNYKKAIVAPGEMVGMIAAQSIGEPTTQMSNLYDEKMRLVKVCKQNKHIDFVTPKMGEFIDDIIQNDPQHTFNTGHHDSVETLIENGDYDYYVIGVDTDETTKWSKISHVSRHPVNGKLLEIKTRSGRKVVTTESHSHLIRCNNTQSVVPIKGSDLSIGMRIPALRNIKNTFIKDHIQCNDNNSYKLDNIFGFFIGAYLAGGSLNGNDVIITNVNSEYSNSEYTNKCIEFSRKYNIEFTVEDTTTTTKTTTTTSLKSSSLKQLIENTCGGGGGGGGGVGTDSSNKKVPSFAYTAPIEFISGLIQGYIDSVSNVYHSKQSKHSNIRVCSHSKELIIDIGILLNYLEIFSTFDQVGPQYQLTISNKYAPVYLSKVGSITHRDELEKLVEYSNGVADVYSHEEDIDKINGLCDVIAYCAETLKLPSAAYEQWIVEEDAIDRETLEKCISTLENHIDNRMITKELDILKQACYSGVVWDEIVEINEYKDYTHKYVYDFTVPGNQTFMTDFGIIVHNTLNSFVYETEILVRDASKQIHKVQMGDFVHKLITYGNDKKTNMEYYPEKDTTYAPTLDDEYWEIQAPDEDGNVEWYKVEAGTRHPVINEDGTNTMLKVITEDEQEIIATKAKSFLMLKEGKLVATRGDELVVGNYVPVSTKTIDHEENHLLHLQDILPPTEYLYGSESFKAMNCWNEPSWWHKYNNKEFVLPYKRSDSFRNRMKELRKGCNNRVEIKNGCVYPKKTWKNSCSLPDVIPLDYDFGFLIGAYCAEGCITRTQISISNNDFDYHRPIQRWCDKYNITTKQYRHENKNKKGWTSSDIRIYSIVLTDLIEKLCGRYSHSKFIHQKLVFSNEEFKKGFINGYIGGDGSVDIRKNKQISSYSVSKQLLSDFNVMLKTLGIYSYIRKRKLQTSNNRGTKPENIHQAYAICVRNSSMVKLAKHLQNNEIKYKAENARKLMEYTPKSTYNKQDDCIPNIVNGVTIMEPRNDRMKDTVFVKIKSIEEVPNTTEYAYDLTVEKTRTFMTVNGVVCFDTFHFAGISSKSNVTRGVPRIEEILSLSKNPKNPSATIALKGEDKFNRLKAQQTRSFIEHTSLRDVVKSVTICFDPDNMNTLIEEDKELISQYKEFNSMIEECMGMSGSGGGSGGSGSGGEDGDEEGKKEGKKKDEYGSWIIRFEMDKEEMLDKNITMDDIHFALKNGYKDEISCVFSDYNSDKLVFRVRLMKSQSKKSDGKKGLLHGVQKSLDQSDEIYMLGNLQENLMDNIVLRGVKGISKVIIRKVQDAVVEEEGNFVTKEQWVLDTVGTNFIDLLGMDDIDYTETTTNDIIELYDVLGIEAARQLIFNEFSEVIEFDGTYINYHHLSLLCDRMCCAPYLIAISRHGINNDNIDPIAKASFEETPEMFLRAARHGEMDNMRGVSANVMCGQEGNFGTGAFQVVLDMNEMAKLGTKMLEKEESIEDMFNIEDEDDACALGNIKKLSNIHTINSVQMGEDNDYNPGF